MSSSNAKRDLPSASAALVGKISSAKPPPQQKKPRPKQPLREQPAEDTDDKQPSTDDVAATVHAPRFVRLRRLLRATPSWLVSSVLHLVALIVLALFTIAPQEKTKATYLVSEVSDDTAPIVMEAQVFTPEVQVTNEYTTSAPSVDSLGFTDVGDVSEATSNPATEGLGDLELSPVGSIGDVFSSKGNGMASAMAGTKGAEFFGVKAAGRKFVFIVDSSNSMKNGKFDDAKKELLYAIQRLTKDQLFYVIFFDQNAERMRLPPNAEPEDHAARASVENIKRAEKWVNSVENELKTNPYESVKYALEMLPDAIYLLSDGQFTDKGRTVAYLKANNIIDDPIDGRRPKVVFHTVGFYSRDGEPTLEGIAKAYGGTYRFVPQPDKKK